MPGAPLPDPDDAGAARGSCRPGTRACSPTRGARGCSRRRIRPLSCSTRGTPQSFPTFLVDGAVAGTWRHADGEIVLDPFAPLRRRHDEAALRAEAVGLAALHA